MVIEAHAVPHPRAVMIEAGNTSVTVGAMLGADRPPKEARTAKVLRLESRPELRQLLDRLKMKRRLVSSSY